MALFDKLQSSCAGVLDTVSGSKKIWLASAAIGAYCWYKQYGKLLVYRARGHPGKTDNGLPLLGHISFLWEGLAPWGRRLYEENGKVFNIYLFGEHVTLIDWEVYEQHVAKAEDAGDLIPQWPPHIKKLIGGNSVLTLRAGKSAECSRHKLLKAKMMQALAPKQVLLLAERMEAAARQMLDKCVEETALHGEASMKALIHRFAFENAAVSVLGDLADDKTLLDEMIPWVDGFMDGLIALVPIDLPVFAFGRAMNGRRALATFLTTLLTKAKTHDSQRNVLAQFVTASSGGRALTEDEMVDSLTTIILAGIITTAFTIPHIIVNLWKHPDWAERIATEARSTPWTQESGIEAPRSEVLKFVRETMRIRPAIDVYRRASVTGPVDLGEYGTVPAGWPIAVLFATHGYDMGDEFDPSRWTPELSRAFVGFGGHGPHHCAGKNLALLEMQIVAQVVANGGYKVEVLDPTVVPELGGMHYKGGLRVKVTRV